MLSLTLLAMVSAAYSQEPPPLPMTVVGYVSVQGTGGQNVSAQDLHVYAKQDSSILANTTTDSRGHYTLPVTGLPDAASFDVWLEATNYTRLIFHDMNVTVLNMTVIDNTPPSIQIISPLVYTPEEKAAWINATMTDNLAVDETSIALTLNGTTLNRTYDSSTGLLSCQTAPLVRGLYDASIYVKDLAGNNATKTWTFRASPVPAITILGPTAAIPVYTQSGKAIQVIFNYTEPSPLNWTVRVSNATYTVVTLTNATEITPGINVTRTVSTIIPLVASEGKYDVDVALYNTLNFNTTANQANAIVVDNTPPTVAINITADGGYVQPSQEVIISASITDAGTGVSNATLSYNIGTATWNDVAMTLNATSGLWEATIPGKAQGTQVKYMISAYDKAGNEAVNDNSTSYFVYMVTTEFTTVTALIILMVFTAILTVLLKRRKIQNLPLK